MILSLPKPNSSAFAALSKADNTIALRVTAAKGSGCVKALFSSNKRVKTD